MHILRHFSRVAGWNRHVKAVLHCLKIEKNIFGDCINQLDPLRIPDGVAAPFDL
jgi:hypothetical protein